MADFADSGPSEPVRGAERSLADVTAMEALQAPPSPVRPDWMVTRWPVSREEFNSLNEQANEASPPAAAPEEGPQEDEETPAEAVLDVEMPEDAEPVAPEAAAPPTTAAFDGIGQTAFTPPDNTIAVGPNDVLAAVNTDLAGYTKLGAQRFRWANMTTLFNPVLPAQAGIFDPRVAYDHYAQRWIVVIAARRQNPRGSWIMLAVSQGRDPAGAYWVWALDSSLDGSNPTANWSDYPMLGFDARGIYLGLSQFAFAGGFQYTKVRILNKAEVYAGGVGSNHFIRWYDIWGLRNPDNSLAFTVQPATHFRGAGGNPPVYLVNALWPSGTSLTLWTLSDALGFWSGRAPALAAASVSCRGYDLPPDAVQPDTATRVETNDSRLLNAMYQFVGGVQRLWTCHTSRHTWPGDSEARSILQWYEIDVPSRMVTQQNGFGAARRYYYFPAVHTDFSRNAYLVFSRSGADEYAQLRQTGRRTGDAAGSLQGSALVAAGDGAYTGGRWGDYFGICRDGSDSRVVWMYGERAARSNSWATRIAAARF
jgi:hypothetical protein